MDSVESRLEGGPILAERPGKVPEAVFPVARSSWRGFLRSVLALSPEHPIPLFLTLLPVLACGWGKRWRPAMGRHSVRPRFV